MEGIMDRKKWILFAAAGVLATKPVLTTASNIAAQIDSALTNARQDVRNEQPLAIDTGTDVSSDELPARMY
jgi:hypothetical protein